MKKINNTLISILNKVFNNKIFSNKIFTSKITLIVVAAIAFLSLYRNIMLYEFSAVLLFFVVAAIAYNFTKNMTIVLGTSFLATLIVGMFKGLFGFKEGLEDNKSNNPLDAMSKMAAELTANDDEVAPPPTQATNSTTTLPSAPTRPRTTTSTASTAPASTAPASTQAPAPASAQAPASTTTTTRAAPAATTEPQTAPATSGYQNQIPLNPGLYTMPNKEQMTKQLGKASETEQAYDNLEKIMGQKNLKTMSSDTQDLIRQQNDLIKQLKSMTPALNEAMNALGGLDLSKLTGMFSRPQE